MDNQSQEKPKIVLQRSHIRVFDFIKKYIDKNVVAPTISEISEGIESPKSYRHVYRIVSDLVELGYISRMRRTERGLSIIRDIRAKNH